MPKKKKAGKNRKTKGVIQEKRLLVEPDLDGQVFGVLEKALGSRFFEVKCLDGKTRRCKVRNKRMRIKKDDVVIVSIREFDDKNADIIYKYNSDEIRELQSKKSLPSTDILGIQNESNENENDHECVFDFNDI